MCERKYWIFLSLYHPKLLSFSYQGVLSFVKDNSHTTIAFLLPLGLLVHFILQRNVSIIFVSIRPLLRRRSL